jgi:predicted PhzF superfamily epimerase YddE/YHI9
LALFESEAQVRALAPDMAALVETGIHGVIATAPGTDCDFVSRFFAPAAGVPEDPVTGSAHTRLTPFWAARLGKTSLHARQVSKRGGELRCTLSGDRVLMAGHVTPYLEGTIEV